MSCCTFVTRVSTVLVLALCSIGCSFDTGGLSFDSDGGSTIDARTFDGGDDIDAPTVDASMFDAVVFDATPDAQTFDAAPPDATPCVCDDFIDCTADSCDPDCVSVDICAGVTTCNATSGLCDGVVTFQEGADGYAGTGDTFLAEGSADAVNGAADVVEWDGDEPFNTDQITAGLVRFDSVFGTATDQIPSGATINAATLTVAILNGSNGTAGEVREVLLDWNESTISWNSFGPAAGIQGGDTGPIIAAAPTVDCGGAPCVNQTADVDVQSSLAAWSLDQNGMNGWIFIATATDGIEIASSDSMPANRRPLLTVEFSVPAP